MNRIITISFIIFLLGFMGREYYADQIDFLNLSQQESYIHWGLGLLRDIGFVFFGLLSISYSLYTYKTEKHSIKILLNVILSISFIFFLSTTSSYMYQLMLKIPSATNSALEAKPDLLKIHNSWLTSNESLKKENIKLTNSMASMMFIDSGITLNVLNEQGKVVLYQPTTKDHETRAIGLKADQLNEYTLRSLLVGSIVNWGVLFLGLVVGLNSPRLLRSYNKAFKRN